MAEISPTFVTIVVFMFGAAIGSFLNVCIHRLPLHESIVFPASHCRACATPLTWHDNLPLMSYLLRWGRCRFCGMAFSFRYFLVELLTALLAVALVYRFGLTITAVGYFAFSAALIVITFIDLDYQIIPDVISLPGAVAGVLFSVISPELLVDFADWSGDWRGSTLSSRFRLPSGHRQRRHGWWGCETPGHDRRVSRLASSSVHLICCLLYWVSGRSSCHGPHQRR